MRRQCWQKLGRVFVPSGEMPWGRSHCTVPTPYAPSDGRLRVYFGARDGQSRTSTTFVELDPLAPTTVTHVHDRPVMPLGAMGCFDDAGVMPSCVVEAGGEQRFYYTGWNTSTTVPYRNAIGVAVSRDGGSTFERAFSGPIVDRHPREPHFCASPFVLRDGGMWRMWHLSCTEWRIVDGRPEPVYLIRHIESDDGFEWRRPGTIAIPYACDDEAITRPWVIKEGSEFLMWYCYRSLRQYRGGPGGYRIGFATSGDGVRWKRQDSAVELATSAGDWDAEMIAYPAVIDLRGRSYLLYNGNGFGASGFGLAELMDAS
jgi:hypothetical protein